MRDNHYSNIDLNLLLLGFKNSLKKYEERTNTNTHQRNTVDKVVNNTDEDIDALLNIFGGKEICNEEETEKINSTMSKIEELTNKYIQSTVSEREQLAKDNKELIESVYDIIDFQLLDLQNAYDSSDIIETEMLISTYVNVLNTTDDISKLEFEEMKQQRKTGKYKKIETKIDVKQTDVSLHDDIGEVCRAAEVEHLADGNNRVVNVTYTDKEMHDDEVEYYVDNDMYMRNNKNEEDAQEELEFMNANLQEITKMFTRKHRVSVRKLQYYTQDKTYQTKNLAKKGIANFYEELKRYEYAPNFDRYIVDYIKEMATKTNDGIGLFYNANYKVESLASDAAKEEEENVDKLENEKEMQDRIYKLIQDSSVGIKERVLSYMGCNIIGIDIDKTTISPDVLLDNVGDLFNYIAAIVPTTSNLKNKGIYCYRVVFVLDSDWMIPKNHKLQSRNVYSAVYRELYRELDKALTNIVDNSDKKYVYEPDAGQPKHFNQIWRVGKGVFYVNANAYQVSTNDYYASYVNRTGKNLINRVKAVTAKDYVKGEMATGKYKHYNIKGGIAEKLLTGLSKYKKGKIFTDRDTWISATYALCNSVLDGYLDLDECAKYYHLICVDEESENKFLEILQTVNDNMQDNDSNRATFATLCQLYNELGTIDGHTYNSHKDFYEYEMNPVQPPVIVDSVPVYNDIYRYFSGLVEKGEGEDEGEDKESGIRICKVDGPFVDKDDFVTTLKTNLGTSTLYVSDTGTGKTHAIFNGLSDMTKRGTTYKNRNVNAKNIYIVAFPNTENLVQIRNDFTALFDKNMIYIGCGTDDENFASNVKRKYNSGCRIFVSTYDSAITTYQLINHEKAGGIKVEALIIDEVHDLTQSYSFRKAIGELVRIGESVMSEDAEDMYVKRIVGLTGTPQIAPLYLFNNYVQVQTTVRSLKTNHLDVVEFKGTAKLADTIYLSIKDAIKDGDVLAFINNKALIDNINKRLVDDGVHTVISTSDTKKDTKLKEILETKKYVDTQVILSTSVLEKGISINNNNGHTIIVTAPNDSQIYCESQMRQMSNRMRKDYKSLIWIRPSVDEDDKEKHSRLIPTMHVVGAAKMSQAKSVSERIQDMMHVSKLSDEIWYNRDIVEEQNNIRVKQDGKKWTTDVSKIGILSDAYKDTVMIHKGALLSLQAKLLDILDIDATQCTVRSYFGAKEIKKEKEKKKLTEEELNALYDSLANEYQELSPYTLMMYREANGLEKLSEKFKDIHNQHQIVRKYIDNYQFLDYDMIPKMIKSLGEDALRVNVYDTFKRFNDMLHYTLLGSVNETSRILLMILDEFKILGNKELLSEIQREASSVELYSQEYLDEKSKELLDSYISNNKLKDNYDEFNTRVDLLNQTKMAQEMDLARVTSYYDTLLAQQNDAIKKAEIKQERERAYNGVKAQYKQVFVVKDDGRMIPIKVKKDDDLQGGYAFLDKDITKLLYRVADKCGLEHYAYKTVKAIFEKYFDKIQLYKRQVPAEENIVKREVVKLKSGKLKEKVEYKREMLYGVQLKDIYRQIDAIELEMVDFVYIYNNFLEMYEHNRIFKTMARAFTGGDKRYAMADKVNKSDLAKLYKEYDNISDEEYANLMAMQVIDADGNVIEQNTKAEKSFREDDFDWLLK